MTARKTSPHEIGPIPKGTLCFLTGRGGTAYSNLIGRVVEVVGGPRAEFGNGPGPFYDIRADWITERFPGRNIIVLRRNLIPITPDSGEFIDSEPAMTSLDVKRAQLREAMEYLAGRER